MREVSCGVCGASLTPGAKFCHDCGAPAGARAAGNQAQAVAPPARGRGVRQEQPSGASRSNLPWVFVALAVVTVGVIYAAQRAGQSAPAPAQGPAPSGAAGVDIASMTPEERASRLFDRIMRLNEEGKRDSVELFASMAVPVYESLGPLDLDGRYDLGRIAQVSGQLDLAQAQADTILARAPSHLLGLILSAGIADARGNQAARSALERRLLDAESSQRALNLDEYTRHKSDIDAAIAAARNRR